MALEIPESQKLRVRMGEELSASKWNAMLDYMDRVIRSTAGSGWTVTQMPNARIFKQRRSGGGSGGNPTSCPFYTTIGVGDGEGDLTATFATGLIAGVKPKIGPNDSDLFIDDQSGDTPIFKFTIGDAMDPATGIGMLYWQLAFNPDFSIQKIYPVALKAPPAKKDYRGWKLIGFLQNAPGDTKSTPTWKQMLFHNLNHVASQRAGGEARHTFWAVS